MIVVIMTMVYDEKLKIRQPLVSHGVDIDTLRSVVLPNVPIERLKDAWFHKGMGEWVLGD